VHHDNLRINNQQDASSIQIFFFYFVTKLYMFRASSVPIIRSYQLYTGQLVRFMQVMWPLPRRVRLEQFRPAHDTATNTEWQLPEAVLTQFVSPDDEHDVLETCRELKVKWIRRKELCVTLVIYQEPCSLCQHIHMSPVSSVLNVQSSSFSPIHGFLYIESLL
jgi:hypothetical protein